MAWTSEQAAIQALMRGRVALSAFVEDITRAIDVLAPSGSAEHGCPGCECACHRGAIASEACVCRGVGGGMVAVPREVFAEAAAAWCAGNCPTQIVGQPGPHRGECVEMRTLLFPVRGSSGEPPTLGERLTASAAPPDPPSGQIIKSSDQSAARQSDPPGLVANWRPIETAPKRTDVLAGWADRPHWLPQVLQQDDAGMWFNGEESDYRPPTHWMPLPASPQAETKGDE